MNRKKILSFSLLTMIFTVIFCMQAFAYTTVQSNPQDITYTCQTEYPTVRYHANGGVYSDGSDLNIAAYSWEVSASPDSLQTGKNVLMAGTYEEPERKTYEFVSWNTKADGTGDTFDPVTASEITEDLDVYAVWNKKEATFLEGWWFNRKLRELSGSGTSWTGVQEAANSKVEAFVHSTEAPEETERTEEHIISTEDSEYKIYAWYRQDREDDRGTIYWWSEADEDDEPTYLNADCENLFADFYQLRDISGLSDVNTSRVENLRAAFYRNISLSDISPLASWDTSNVTNLSWLFGGANWSPHMWDPNVNYIGGCMGLTNLDALADWDVSKVTNYWRMCTGAYNLSDISGIADWDVREDADFSGMFNYTRFALPVPIFNSLRGVLRTPDNYGTFHPGSVIRLHMNGGTWTYWTPYNYGDPSEPIEGITEYDLAAWVENRLEKYTPTWEGHTFSYWNNEPDGSGDQTYYATDSTPVYDRYTYDLLDLYAIWDVEEETEETTEATETTEAAETTAAAKQMLLNDLSEEETSESSDVTLEEETSDTADEETETAADADEITIFSLSDEEMESLVFPDSQETSASGEASPDVTEQEIESQESAAEEETVDSELPVSDEAAEESSEAEESETEETEAEESETEELETEESETVKEESTQTEESEESETVSTSDTETVE